ncbi:apolipoprotein C-I [Clinocottus analis]|uniref:apolipoprotein C-I n=1 Tax=Clinocottus analis TaxID=304258 RepID=UPI0035BFAF0C
MRVYLAVAVLMLAFVAYTEAQEQTMEQKFADFTQQVSDVTSNLAEKAKATFEDIKTSKFAVDSRDWFQTQIEKMKEHFA